MMTTNILFVYVTCANVEEAEALASHCVEQNLAACGNILPGMRSVYRWKGHLQYDDETILLLKSTRPLFDQLEAAIKERHSYEVPCITAFEADKGHEPYLEWIRQHCR